MLKPGSHWMLAFVVKILGWMVVLNLIVLLILWVLKVLNLFTLILLYEALFILIVGVFQILGTHIYRRNSIPYHRGVFGWVGSRIGWFDYKRFAKLKPEERQRYRKEGIIMVIIGLVLLIGTIIAHFYILTYS